MNMQNKRSLITLLVLGVCTISFLAGALSGIAIQQKYDYDKAFLDSLIVENRTCWDNGEMGYCKKLTGDQCINYTKGVTKTYMLPNDGL